MKIMVDTNIIISALVFGGQAEKILHILFESEHNLYISEYIDKEIAEVFCSPTTMLNFLHSQQNRHNL